MQRIAADAADDDAWAELYRRQAPVLRRAAQRISLADAEDAVQVVFLRLHAGVSEITCTSAAALQRMLILMAERAALDLARSATARLRRERSGAASVSEEASPSVRTVLLADHIMRLLPEDMRAVLRLRYIEGRSVRDTAAALGFGESQVKMLSSRAIEQARRIAASYRTPWLR
jgi:RNA polymerase sigma-70 factor (ECF subfamily)